MGNIFYFCLLSGSLFASEQDALYGSSANPYLNMDWYLVKPTENKPYVPTKRFWQPLMSFCVATLMQPPLLK